VREPIVTAEIVANPPPKGVRKMETLLFDPTVKPAPGSRPRVILVAASGGGTRAALYTSSLLDGLRQQKVLHDVKAVSGVSGGGAALAYFAAHHKELAAIDNPAQVDQAWERYHEAMAYPYFTDVLCGTSEFRIPWQTSISTLLPESFERQFYKTTVTGTAQTLGDCEIGIIFNTTLAGESPPPFTLKKFKPTNDIRCSEFASGMFAGTRLILTNLADAEAFPCPQGQQDPNKFKYPWNEVLRYVVLNDPNIRLTRAAALNANFPPVFPNAPVDVKTQDQKHRYWVTDGGAEENRGQVSILYAVRHAIAQRAKHKGSVLPDIHVIVAEASGGSVAYKQDYGVSAFSGASQKLVNQLALELEREIDDLYGRLHEKKFPDQVFTDLSPDKSRPKIKVHFLPMPSVSRIDGGVGTHWMLPETVRLGPPTVHGVPTDPDIHVNKATVQYLIRQLHNPDVKPPLRLNPADDIKQVQKWIAEDPFHPPHPQAWRELCADLTAKRP
jgi:hypothetical protein